MQTDSDTADYPGKTPQINRLGKQVTYNIRNEDISALQDAKQNSASTFHKVGILVISYNASDLLRQTIERIPLGLLDIVEEIFIFDDASQDNTFEVALELLKSSPWRHKLSVFKNPKNLGYGGNQKAGFRYGIERGLDSIVMLHGDGQYAPEHLPELIVGIALEKHPVVFGSRMVRRMDALAGGMPLYKWLGNQVLTKFENLILGIDLAEYHTGYRVYSTDVLKRIPFEENTNEFHFDSQIIVQVRALGAGIHEVPIKTFYGDEVCHVNGLKYAKDVCLSVLEYRLHQLHIIRRSRYLVKQDFTYTKQRSPYSSHEQILKLIQKPGRALEVSTKGLLTESLNARKVTSVGIDRIPASQIKTMYDRYEQHDLEHPETLVFQREFDYVILSDSLEQVRNAQQLLSRVRGFMKADSGLLIVSVHNIAVWCYRLALFCGRFNYGVVGTLDDSHVRLYTLDTIKQTLERSGYRIKNLTYTSLPFESVFESSGKSRLIKGMDRLYFKLAQFWPRMFAYQIIVEAEVAALDAKDKVKI